MLTIEHRLFVENLSFILATFLSSEKNLWWVIFIIIIACVVVFVVVSFQMILKYAFFYFISYDIIL